MVLASFGCSFVWGTELPDCTDQRASLLSWPALIAQHLSMDYRCHAQGGRGNVWIADQLMAHASSADFLVVNWTFLDRVDLRSDQGLWHTLRPGDPDCRDYFAKWQNDHRDKLISLMCIKNCLDYLDALNKPFLMTWQDPLLFDINWHTTTSTYVLQKMLRPRMTDFDGHNHCVWAQAQGHPLTAGGHLPQTGQSAVAQYLISRINTTITRSEQCNLQKTSA